MGFLGGIVKSVASAVTSVASTVASAVTPFGIGGALVQNVLGGILNQGVQGFGLADQFMKMIPGLNPQNLLGMLQGIGKALPSALPPMPSVIQQQPPIGQGGGSIGQQMLDKLGGQLGGAYQEMNNAINSVDKNDPQSQLKAQQAIQDFKQLMETMTNIMKLLHEMNMSVIRNMK